MSEFWTSALESAGSHLGAGWFWLFPLVFAIHDAEEATSVWIKGSLHNSISYTTLNVTQMLMAISFELTIFMAAAAWAAEPGAWRLAIFTFAVLLGGYTAHGFVHLYLGWRAHRYTLGVATALPLVVFGGVLIYAKLIETGTLSWTLAAASFVLGALIMLPLIRAARLVGLTFA
ncbi:MAG: HXXEE domain-containing protein [Xanthobacteraceae bacterium]